MPNVIDGRTTWLDDMIGRILLSWLMLLPAGPGLANDLVLSEAMVIAGAEALAQELPRMAGTDLASAARAAFMAMQPHQWQPIDTAPKDRKVLLGLVEEDEFRMALGSWEIVDEPPEAGRWTATSWWGVEPTHWMEIPPLPSR